MKLTACRLRRRTVLLWLAVLTLAVPAALAAQPLLRISLENTEDHVQVKAVQRFAQALADRTRGELRVELYADGRLFRDRDVVAALVHGQVEMAVPGTWQLDRFEPAVGILLLPPFYGRDRNFISEHMDDLVDGMLGQEINRRLEESTGAVVLGRWIDLGPVHLFTVRRPVRRHDDIKGLRIRYAGGVVNEMRLAALGAEPMLVPWPDFPQRLAGGEVDGVLTSFETVASARLWEAGVRYAFEDAQYVGQYVPLVSPQFWRRLPESLRTAVTETWEEHVDQARSDAAAAQAAARRRLQEHGVTIVTPSTAELRRVRMLLNETGQEMIRRLGVDHSLLPLVPDP